MLVVPYAALARNIWVQKQRWKAPLGCIVTLWSLSGCSPLSSCSLLRYLIQMSMDRCKLPSHGPFLMSLCIAQPPGCLQDLCFVLAQSHQITE